MEALPRPGLAANQYPWREFADAVVHRAATGPSAAAEGLVPPLGQEQGYQEEQELVAKEESQEEAM